MPIKQGTTSPGPRSETHGRFGQRRTPGNLNSFDTPTELNYVERGDNNAEDAAAQVRGKLLKGGILEDDMATIRGYYNIGDPLQNPLKYDYVNTVKFGPNLKPPIVTAATDDDPGTADIDEFEDAVINEAAELITHTYGSMGSEPGENRKQPFQTSLHPRSVRPTITDENVSHSGVSARQPAQEGNEAEVDANHEDFQPRIER